MTSRGERARGKLRVNTLQYCKTPVKERAYLTMVKRCVAADCSNTYKDGVSLFLFPKSESLSSLASSSSSGDAEALSLSLGSKLYDANDALVSSSLLSPDSSDGETRSLSKSDSASPSVSLRYRWSLSPRGPRPLLACYIYRSSSCRSPSDVTFGTPPPKGNVRVISLSFAILAKNHHRIFLSSSPSFHSQ